MASIAQLTVKIRGRVQGVCFRDFVNCLAIKLNLQGYVCNLPDGETVEVQAVGEKEKLNSLITNLRKGPPGSMVKEVEIVWSEQINYFDDFSIRY